MGKNQFAGMNLQFAQLENNPLCPHGFNQPQEPSNKAIDELFESKTAQIIGNCQCNMCEGNKQILTQQNKVNTRKERRKRQQRSTRENTGNQSKLLNRGHWKQYEAKMYHLFLQIHFSHFIDKKMRRLDKVFKIMQTFLKTREAEQCRSHHQKLQNKHGEFLNILKTLRQKYHRNASIESVRQALISKGFDSNIQILNLQVNQTLTLSYPNQQQLHQDQQKVQNYQYKQQQLDFKMEDCRQDMDLFQSLLLL